MPKLQLQPDPTSGQLTEFAAELCAGLNKGLTAGWGVMVIVHPLKPVPGAPQDVDSAIGTVLEPRDATALLTRCAVVASVAVEQQEAANAQTDREHLTAEELQTAVDKIWRTIVPFAPRGWSATLMLHPACMGEEGKADTSMCAIATGMEPSMLMQIFSLISQGVAEQLKTALDASQIMEDAVNGKG